MIFHSPYKNRTSAFVYKDTLRNWTERTCVRIIIKIAKHLQMEIIIDAIKKYLIHFKKKSATSHAEQKFIKILRAILSKRYRFKIMIH